MTESESKTTGGPTAQVVVAVTIALLVGGTAPWWWKDASGACVPGTKPDAKAIQATYSVLPDMNEAKSVGSFRQSDHMFECPDGTVLIGRFHTGDENGTSGYRYAALKTRPDSSWPITTVDDTWSEWMSESSGDWFRAPRDRVLTGYEHSGDEKGKTRYRTSAVFLDGEPVSVVDRSDGEAVKESDSNWHLAPAGRVLTGRMHSGDENGPTTHETGSMTIALVR